MQPLEITVRVNARGGFDCQVTGSNQLAKDHGQTVLAEIAERLEVMALAADHAPHLDDRIGRAV